MVAWIVAGSSQKGQKIGLSAVGNIRLGTVEKVMITLIDGGGRQSADIGTRTGLGDRYGTDHLSGNRLGQIGLLEIFASVLSDGGGGHMRLDGNGHGDARGIDFTHFLCKYEIMPVVESLPTVFRIKANSQKSEITHLLKEFVKRSDLLFFPRFHVGIDFLVHEFANSLPDHLMFFVEIERVRHFFLRVMVFFYAVQLSRSCSYAST